MKKALICLLCLFLLLPAVSLGETALTAFDFGDFTMEIDPDTPGSVDKKSAEGPFLTLYPASSAEPDTPSVFMVSWSEEAWDLSTAESREAAIEQIVLDVRMSYSPTVTVKLKTVLPMQVDGRDAAAALLTVIPEEKGGKALNQLVAVVPGDFGRYTFTGSSSDAGHIGRYFLPLLRSVRWREEIPVVDGRITLEAQDFFISLPAGEPYRLQQKDERKISGQALLMVCPAYEAKGDALTRLNVYWLDEYRDLSAAGDKTLKTYLNAFRKGMVSAIRQSWQDQGLNPEVSVTVDAAQRVELGGKQALSIPCQITVSWTDEAGKSQTGQDSAARILLLTDDLGTYCFICMAENGEAMENVIEPMLQSVTWKE